jgi:hypothetical protein
MPRDIILDGAEISILKAIGIGGGEISGEQLVARVPHLDYAELVDTLKGMIAMGYVVSDKQSFRNSDELDMARLHVNSGYSRELKEAMDPRPEKPKSRRVRRE